MPDSRGRVASGFGYTVPALVSLMAAWVIVRRRSARLSLLHSRARCTAASGTLTLVCAAVASRAATLLAQQPQRVGQPGLERAERLRGAGLRPGHGQPQGLPAGREDRFQVSCPPRPLVPNTVCWAGRGRPPVAGAGAARWPAAGSPRPRRTRAAAAGGTA